MAGKKEAKKVHEKRQSYRASTVKTGNLDKTLNDLRENNARLLKRIDTLEERLTRIESNLPDDKTIVIRAVSREDAEKAICNLFSKGETLYYSDIAERLNLDLESVVDICNELQRRGEIKVK